MASKKVPYAWKTYFKLLNGVFCIYKPTGFTQRVTIEHLRRNMVKDLNALPLYRHEITAYKALLAGSNDTNSSLEQLPGETTQEALPGATTAFETLDESIVEETAKFTGQTDSVFSLSKIQDARGKKLRLKDIDKIGDGGLSYHGHQGDRTCETGVIEAKPLPRYHNLRLVLGDVFEKEDVYIFSPHPLNYNSSGLELFGIGPMGRTLMHAIQDAAYLTVYHVKGRFGYATDNFFHDGKFIERSTYGHVTQGKLDKVCSAAQTSHQRLMFTYAGVDPQSQDAYELASRGIVRPSSLDTPPILYGVKCIHFNPPDFTLEIHAINEYCEYLAELVNDVGMQLKTTAVCTHIHRIRHGYFELSDALLYRKWNVGDILDNMKQCRRHLTFDKLCTGFDIRERNEEYDGVNDDDDDDNDEFQSEKQFQKIFDSESASLQEMLKEYTKRKELIKKERSEQMSTKSTSENEDHLSDSDINDETNNGVQSSVVK